MFTIFRFTEEYIKVSVTEFRKKRLHFVKNNDKLVRKILRETIMSGETLVRITRCGMIVSECANGHCTLVQCTPDFGRMVYWIGSARRQS